MTTEIENCVGYLIDITSKDGECFACLPGFSPTFTDGVIDSCTAILDLSDTNCDETDSANFCDKCIFTVESDGTIDLLSCVVYNVITCFGAKTNDETCDICNPEFELVDGNCLQLPVSGCSKVNFYNGQIDNFTFTGNNWIYYLYLQQNLQNIGCTSCDDGYTLVKNQNQEELDSHICLEFNIEKPKDELDEKYKTNCINFGYVGGDLNQVVCTGCGENYILLTEEHVCSDFQYDDEDSLPNCKVALNSGSFDCIKCADDYLNIGGLCKHLIADVLLELNCVELEDTHDEPYPSCKECKDEYYINDDNLDRKICEEITQEFCTEYDHYIGCLKCEKGYGVVATEKNNQKGYCLIMDDGSEESNYVHDNNCEEIKTRYFISYSVESDELIYQLGCNKCKDDFFLDHEEMGFEYKCYEIVEPVEHCTKYDNSDENIKENTFDCLSCDSGENVFLELNSHTCEARLVDDENCNEYEPNLDRCKKCVTGYKLNEDGTECVLFTDVTVGGYVHTCVPLRECDNTVKYGGLGAELNALYSCHQCKNPDQIPFLAVKMEEDINDNPIGQIDFLLEYELDVEEYLNPMNGAVVQCLEPVKESFGIQSDDNFNFPENCALGIINTKYAPNAMNSDKTTYESDEYPTDGSGYSVMCSKCKPGYRTSSHVVKIEDTKIKFNYGTPKCTKINNCAFSRWFNVCTQCEPGYAFDIDMDIIYYHYCYETSDPNCYAYNSTEEYCVYCKKGTKLSKDKKCEEIVPHRCENRSFKM